MIALLVVLLCILSAFAAALWGLWQYATVPRRPRPAWSSPADEAPLPAWLVERVNEAGKHIARNRVK